jgi:hypothetical protein
MNGVLAVCAGWSGRARCPSSETARRNNGARGGTGRVARLAVHSRCAANIAMRGMERKCCVQWRASLQCHPTDCFHHANATATKLQFHAQLRR